MSLKSYFKGKFEEHKAEKAAARARQKELTEKFQKTYHAAKLAETETYAKERAAYERKRRMEQIRSVGTKPWLNRVTGTMPRAMPTRQVRYVKKGKKGKRRVVYSQPAQRRVPSILEMARAIP